MTSTPTPHPDGSVVPDLTRIDTTDLAWRGSCLYTSATGCRVQIAETSTGVLVRDGSRPDGPILPLSRYAWRDLLLAIASGEMATHIP